MSITFFSIILWVWPSGLEVSGTRATLKSGFLKKSLQWRKMTLLNFWAPEFIVNVGVWGRKACGAISPGPTSRVEIFMTMRRSVQLLYASHAIFPHQL